MNMEHAPIVKVDAWIECEESDLVRFKLGLV